MWREAPAAGSSLPSDLALDPDVQRGSTGDIHTNWLGRNLKPGEIFIIAIIQKMISYGGEAARAAVRAAPQRRGRWREGAGAWSVE